MLSKWYWRVMGFWTDRGEGPVPYIIMVALMAAAALLIAGGVTGVATDWLNNLKTDSGAP